jgi:hypothetical protein
VLGERAPGNAPYGFPYPEVLDYRNQETGLTDLTGSTCAPFSVTEGDKPEMIWGEMTSANYFSPLEVRVVSHLDDDYRPWKRWFEIRLYPAKDQLSRCFFRTSPSVRKWRKLRTGLTQHYELPTRTLNSSRIRRVTTCVHH